MRYYVTADIHGFYTPFQKALTSAGYKKSEEAACLLAYTDKSLIAISDYLGFSSQSHFARVFKKYLGSTPSEYRNNLNI